MDGPILVTGATGNVGTELVRRLRATARPVRAAVGDVARGRARLGDGVDVVRFDFGDPATYEAAFADVRALFLLRPPAIADVGRRIVPAVDAAVRAGVERIVFLSLQGVERNPVVPHARIERHLRAVDVPWTFLRPSFFMQNLSTTHRDDIREHDRIFVPAGRGRTSFVDARDVAAVAALTLTEAGHERRAYELTGPEALDYARVAEVFGRVLGRPIRYADPSLPRFWTRMRARGYPAGFVAVMIGLYTVARLGLAARVTPELGRLLGRPPIALERFVRDHAECWR
jgi:uncharacterized protein YbjT (DUF2867 family)